MPEVSGVDGHDDCIRLRTSEQTVLFSCKGRAEYDVAAAADP